MTGDPTAIETLLRRERLVVVGGLLLITALAWGWVLIGSGTGMSAMSMTTWRFPPPIHVAMVENWTIGYALVMFFMWWIMMIAMMTPSAFNFLMLIQCKSNNHLYSIFEVKTGKQFI